MKARESVTKPIRIGLSMCLLGEKVRFDSGHKKDRYITDTLGRFFEFVPVCPELEVGMGVPREPVRLVSSSKHIHMVGVKSGTDWTEMMTKYSDEKVKMLKNLGLSGFILKSDSPSCGMERVRIYIEEGMPSKNGRGLFAERLIREMPLMPIEEEGRLNDSRIRENFIVRVFAYYHFSELVNNKFSLGALVRFHTDHKYLLLAHSPKHYEYLGRIVAHGKKLGRSELIDKYGSMFMEGLGVKSSTKKNVNVLQHIIGFLRDQLTMLEKDDILQTIDDYHKELVPLIVPITLIRHYIKKYDIAYIKDQVYLTPHPKELMLRNYV
jgi:uncharacterized protein YbgA (DUF1722 family)/uncharacterized protein YbbK (DUF523 family)